MGVGQPDPSLIAVCYLVKKKKKGSDDWIPSDADIFKVQGDD